MREYPIGCFCAFRRDEHEARNGHSPAVWVGTKGNNKKSPDVIEVKNVFIILNYLHFCDIIGKINRFDNPKEII